MRARGSSAGRAAGFARIAVSLALCSAPAWTNAEVTPSVRRAKGPSIHQQRLFDLVGHVTQMLETGRDNRLRGGQRETVHVVLTTLRSQYEPSKLGPFGRALDELTVVIERMENQKRRTIPYDRKTDTPRKRAFMDALRRRGLALTKPAKLRAPLGMAVYRVRMGYEQLVQGHNRH